jgi:antitoxin HicB
MKTIAVERFPEKIKNLVEAAQQERVVVTRKEKPIAILLGIENKDEEDIALERDTAFWKMIRERRRQKTIPLGEVKKRLGLLKENANTTNGPRYAILIQWSEEDQAYLVFLPEFGKGPQTHGDSYDEAMKNAQEVLELLIGSLEENGRDLPKPRTYETKGLRARKTKKRISHGKTERMQKLGI